MSENPVINFDALQKAVPQLQSWRYVEGAYKASVFSGYLLTYHPPKIVFCFLDGTEVYTPTAEISTEWENKTIAYLRNVVDEFGLAEEERT